MNKTQNKQQLVFFHFLVNIFKFLEPGPCRVSVSGKSDTGLILMLKLEMLSSSQPALCCQRKFDRIIEERGKLPPMDGIGVWESGTGRINSRDWENNISYHQLECS